MSKQVEAGALDRAVEAMAKTMYGPRAWEYADDDIQEPWRSDARECIQAADDHLREHYWAEFRERLLGDDCVDAVAREVWQTTHQHPWEMVPEKFKDMRRSSARRHLSVLATTQHKGGSQ